MQRLVDRHVEQLLGRHSAVFLQVLAYSVVDHDRIVERIADDGQNRGDRGQIELHLGQREQADGQDHVVDQADQRADPELPFEADPDIDRDRDRGETERLERGPAQFLGNLARNRIDPVDPRIRMVSLDRGGNPFRHGIGQAGIGLRTLGQAQPDRHRVGRAEGLDDRLAITQLLDLAAQCPHRRFLALGERHADHLPADKVDALVEALGEQQHEAADHQHHAEDCGRPLVLEEVDVGIVGNELEQTHGSGSFRCGVRPGAHGAATKQPTCG